MHALTFLGTGSGWPNAQRHHTSLLLETGGRRYLLDAGEPCSHRLKALGVPAESIDAVFLSHGHSDHLSGLPMLIQGAWLEGRTRPLPIFAPGELIAPIRAWLDAVYLPAQVIGFSLQFQAWETLPGRTAGLEDGALRVSVTDSTHLHGLRRIVDSDARDRFLAYSLVYTWPRTGQRLVFSADLGEPEDLEAALAVPCDLLVCELAHFSPERLFTYLRHKPIRQLCLTHLDATLRTPSEEIRAQATVALPQIGHIAVVADGDRVEF